MVPQRGRQLPYRMAGFRLAITQFVNQIVWKRQTAHSDIGQGAKHMGRLHDVLLLYGNSETITWNMQYQAYDEEWYSHT